MVSAIRDVARREKVRTAVIWASLADHILALTPGEQRQLLARHFDRLPALDQGVSC
jgi:hypothetical protein